MILVKRFVEGSNLRLVSLVMAVLVLAVQLAPVAYAAAGQNGLGGGR